MTKPLSNNHTHALWLALKPLVREIFWQARGVIEWLNPPAKTKGVIKGDNWIVHPGLLSAWSNIYLRCAESVIGHCYVLTLPPLFLTHPHPFIHPSMKLLILGIALLSSPTSPTLFLLTPLISFSALPLNHSVSSPYYALGHILPTASLTSAPIALMRTPQSSGLWLAPIRLIVIP